MPKVLKTLSLTPVRTLFTRRPSKLLRIRRRGQKLTQRHVLGRPKVIGDLPHHNLHRVVERHVASIRAHALPVGLVGDGGGLHVGDEDPLIGFDMAGDTPKIRRDEWRRWLQSIY